MPVDTQAATGSDADRTRVAPPSLTPIQVASGPEVEQQLRSARAGLASLNLKVRTATRAADLAEAEVPADLVDDETLQQAAALDLARQRQAEDELAARQTELATDFQREQAEADAVVEAARVQAVAIVAEPTQRLDALLRSRRAPKEAATALVTEAPTPVAIGPATATPAPYLAYIVPSPDGSVQPALLRLPTYPQQQPPMMQAVPVQMIAAPGWGQPAAAWGPPAPGWGEAPVAAPVVQQPAPKTPFMKRLMHLDVLLPLLAVIIVLAVLAAWVL